MVAFLFAAVLFVEVTKAHGAFNGGRLRIAAEDKPV